jgi:hypothetical protein
VLPSRNTLKQPIAHSTLNQAIRSLDLGVRGVYNKAEYLTRRREMLQWWADLVDAQIEEGRKVVIGRLERRFTRPSTSPV